MPVQPATTERERGHDERAAAGHAREVVEPADDPERHRPAPDGEVEDVAVGEARAPGRERGRDDGRDRVVASSPRSRSSATRRTRPRCRAPPANRRTTSSYASASIASKATLARLPGAVDSAASRHDEAGRDRPGSGDRARIECRIERGARRGLDPVVGSDVGPGDLDLAAFDADLEDRREGPDRHGQGQDQERQVAGRRVPAECPEAEDRDEVAPAGAHPAEAADRQREEADVTRPTARPMSTGVAARNGSNPRLAPAAVCARQPAFAQQPGGGQRDDDRRHASNTSRRGRTRKTGGSSRSRSRRARRADRHGGREQEGGRTERHEDRPDRRQGTRASAHEEPGEGEAEQGGRDRDQQPLPQLRGQQLPARRPAAARQGQRRAPATDDEDADQPDRAGGHGQRSERGDRQGRLGRRPLLEIALDEAEQPRANEHPPGTDRAGRHERGVEPAQVRHERRPACPASSRSTSVNRFQR